MNETDRDYQSKIDSLAEELLSLSLQELLEWPDFGSINGTVGVDSIEIGFWHWTFSNENHHIIFITDRSIGLCSTNVISVE
jgi:hypothetical protein